MEKFIEFCRSKGDEDYVYTSPYNCPIAQFLIAQGHTRVTVSGYGHWWSEQGEGQMGAEAALANGLLFDNTARTFSAIVARYETQRPHQ